MQIYIDGIKVYQVVASKVDTYATVARGTHRIRVQAQDAAGRSCFKSASFTVK